MKEEITVSSFFSGQRWSAAVFSLSCRIENARTQFLVDDDDDGDGNGSDDDDDDDDDGSCPPTTSLSATT